MLSYAPGPLQTEMYEEIRLTCGNKEIVEMFNASKEQVSEAMVDLWFSLIFPSKINLNVYTIFLHST